MIIFIKDIADSFRFKNSYHYSISDNLTDLEDVCWLIPHPSIVNDYINTGNKSEYRESYYRYLNSPKISLMLYRLIYETSKIRAFFCYTKMEEELLYPKFLKDYISKIIPGYCTDYISYDGECKSYDKNTIKKLISKIINLDKKYVEMSNVLK